MCRRWVCLGKIIFGAHAVSKRLRIPENKILSFSDRKHSVTCRPNNLIKFLKTIAMSVPTIAEDQLFCKSNQKSIELRTKGNEKYAESQWQQALDFYNRVSWLRISKPNVSDL